MDAFTILFSFFLISLVSSTSSKHCPPSYCGQNTNHVQYPFRLVGEQPETCGSPGFNLHCENHTTMLIHFSKSSQFAVRSIDYDSQSIHIYDPLDCLPSRLLMLDLSDSPFLASNTRNYTLLTCPNDGTLSGFDTIGCLSNSSFSTLATTSKSLVSSIIGNHTACRILGVFRFPDGEPQYDPEEFSSTIRFSFTGWFGSSSRRWSKSSSRKELESARGGSWRRGPGSSSRGGSGLSSQLIGSGSSSKGGSVSSSKGVSGSSSSMGSGSSPKGGSPGSSWKPNSNGMVLTWNTVDKAYKAKSGKKHKKKHRKFSGFGNNGKLRFVFHYI